MYCNQCGISVKGGVTQESGGILCVSCDERKNGPPIRKVNAPDPKSNGCGIVFKIAAIIAVVSAVCAMFPKPRYPEDVQKDIEQIRVHEYDNLYKNIATARGTPWDGDHGRLVPPPTELEMAKSRWLCSWAAETKINNLLKTRQLLTKEEQILREKEMKKAIDDAALDISVGQIMEESNNTDKAEAAFRRQAEANLRKQLNH